ncbi:pectate lyase [Acrocarpospora phusangensis]|uniref:Pectate lyase n=1 Tax=Acrocarpospora phusangensis TaxID=1070424 RepID=A0A919QBE5_9ACTN|nr:pectate lyase [Acrocarpospora phusangensis]GIH24255.1 pectate lyase [Acrocarpospora phusangensis]
MRKTALATALLAVSCLLTAPAAAVDLGRQTLPAGDGWGSEGAGTTGGSAATTIHQVSTRSQFVTALAAPGPKIIYVKGVVDGNTDDAGRKLTCASYARNGYTLAGYLAAYDPATWGTADPSGPMEDARAASAAAQTAHIKRKVGANTTIVGLPGAVLRGFNLHVDKVDNVIIRNITFEDAYDCFPQWDPTDGATGNWNSLYDNISVTGSTHVWADHNTFTDGRNPDSAQPVYFGRPYQVHDGQLDITNGSDFVTVSWNVFRGHDKTMLIGSTNNPAQDLGKLRVTVHHNAFDTTLQRLPRVRFGQVHVYNNYYEIPDAEDFVYALGVGVQSQIFAENNFFRLGRAVDPATLLYNWGGTALTTRGDVLRVGGKVTPIDLVAVYNAKNDPDFLPDAGWTPTLHTAVEPAEDVRRSVSRHAGAGEVS